MQHSIKNDKRRREGAPFCVMKDFPENWQGEKANLPCFSFSVFKQFENGLFINSLKVLH